MTGVNVPDDHRLFRLEFFQTNQGRDFLFHVELFAVPISVIPEALRTTGTYGEFFFGSYNEQVKIRFSRIT